VLFINSHLAARQPLTADVRIAEEKTSMISTILAAGVVAAVLLPSGEPTGCMGKKRKDSGAGRGHVRVHWSAARAERCTWKPVAVKPINGARASSAAGIVTHVS
jgi:hypothetical protein